MLPTHSFRGYHRSSNALADDGLFCRYSVTKLLGILLVRELAKHSPTPPVITAVNPGFCKSDFLRNLKGPAVYIVAGLKWIMARSTEVGSRTLVAGACAGKASHGKYMADSANQEPAGWISTEEGVKLQRRVYEQTLDVLEKIEPGISRMFDQLSSADRLMACTYSPSSGGHKFQNS